MLQTVCTINRGLIGKAIVYLNEGEYMVKFWRGKDFQRGAEYYSDDKEDAIATAHHQIWIWGENAKLIESIEG